MMTWVFHAAWILHGDTVSKLIYGVKYKPKKLATWSKSDMKISQGTFGNKVNNWSPQAR